MKFSTGEKSKLLKGAALLLAFVAFFFFIQSYYAQRGIIISIPDAARFLAYVVFLVMPQGFVFIRIAGFDLNKISCGVYEKTAIIATTGYVVSALLCYFINCSPVPWAYPVLSAVAFAAFLRLATTGGKMRANAKALATGADVIAGAMLLLVLARFLITYCYLSGGDAPQYRQFLMDNRYHASIIHEMFRGLPLRGLPQMSGVPFYQYHIMGHLSTWMPIKYFGVNFQNAFHVYMPALCLALVFAHGFFAGKRIGGGKVFGFCAAFLVFFVCWPPNNVWFMKFQNPTDIQLYEYFVSFTSMAALPIVAAFIHVFSAWKVDEETKGAGVICGTLAAVLCVYKINFFILVFPAFMLTLLVLFARKSSERKTIAYAGTAALIVLVLCALVYLQYEPVRNTRFAFGAIADLIYQRYFSENFATAWTGGAGAAAKYFKMLIAALFLPALMAGAVGAAPLLLWLGRRSRDNTNGALKIFFLFFTASLLFAFFFLLDPKHPVNIVLYLPLCVFVVSAILAAGGLRVAADIAKKALGEKPFKALKIVVAALAASAVVVTSSRTIKPEGVQSFPLPGGEISVLKYIYENAPQESVVMTSDFEYGLCGLFGGRRTVAEVDWMRLYYEKEYSRRADDINKFFATESADEAENILSNYGVDYVVVTNGYALHFPYDGILDKEYESGDSSLYRVVRPVKK